MVPTHVALYQSTLVTWSERSDDLCKRGREKHAVNASWRETAALLEMSTPGCAQIDVWTTEVNPQEGKNTAFIRTDEDEEKDSKQGPPPDKLPSQKLEQ